MTLAATQIEAGYKGAPVLRGVTVAFAPGRVTAVLGPNGAGKSTLLRVLIGSLTPAAGTVTLDGVAIASMPRVARASSIALVPQTTVAWASYSVLQTVRLGRLAFGEPPEVATRLARSVLREVGLEDRADEPLATLSAGQQQRALLARAIAQLGVVEASRQGDAPARPSTAESGGRYLLADEPVASMDPRHALESLRLLRRVASTGIGVVVVLHDFALAGAYADDAVLLDGGGRVAAIGEVGQTLRPSVLDPVFETAFAMVQPRAGERAFPHPVARP